MTPRPKDPAETTDGNAGRVVDSMKRRTVAPTAKPKTIARKRFPTARREAESSETPPENA